MGHPLDPLSPLEISSTSKIIRNTDNLPEKLIFNSISLLEPPKSLLAPKLLATGPLSFKDEGDTPRKSLSYVIDGDNGNVYEITVNLTEGKVEEINRADPGSQPIITPEDCDYAERIAKESVEVQEKCRLLGLNDMGLITADPWSIGYNGEPDFENKRLVQLFMYKRNFEGDNHYAHPLNFVVVVDIIAGQILKIDDLPIHSRFKVDTGKEVKVPDTPNNYDPDFLPKDFFRKDVKPLEAVQPEGVSFTVNGNHILWQKFSMRISFNNREGLVLHDIRYQDGDKLRPLFYRLSLSEMVVPYGDPRPPFHRKCAFDLGEYGLGFCANSLALGCDCLGSIKYFDGILNNHQGEPTVIKNAVCLHEEDAGLLHKHTEYRTGKVVLSRSRRLVLSFISTVVNYEYAFYWYFYQDGTISFEVKATGELSTNLLADGANPYNSGTSVFPNINAQYHQHIFCMRIDPMIDGRLNSLAVVDVRPLEENSTNNPYSQGFTVDEKIVSTSKSSITDVEASTSRYWKILNPKSIHPFTQQPVGWKLIPSGSSFPRLLAGPKSNIRKRAGFAAHSVWATQHRDDELFAAGTYVNQSKGGEGVSKWVERDEKVEEEDIVIWHSFGVTHIPRVEDFPIMPVESTGFSLKPVNFFLSNPAIDVPPPGKMDTRSKLAFT